MGGWDQIFDNILNDHRYEDGISAYRENGVTCSITLKYDGAQEIISPDTSANFLQVVYRFFSWMVVWVAAAHLNDSFQGRNGSQEFLARTIFAAVVTDFENFGCDRRATRDHGRFS